MLEPVSGISGIALWSLVGRASGSRRSDGLLGSSPLHNSSLPSISEYYSPFRVWLDVQRFAAVPGVSYFLAALKPLTSTGSPLRLHVETVAASYTLASVQ